MLYRFYQNYNTIHFTFNYSALIVTYLKCLFYRVHIKNTTLNNKEEKIYNNYSNLIVSTEPLIFKYIDFFKDELNIYSYENIGIIYYEYDLTNNTYITYNSKYNGHKNVVDTLDRNVTLYRIFPLLINGKHSDDFVDKKFIMEQLNIDNFDYNRIYNSFNYNNYYNNNTYFKYSGDPNSPFSPEVSDTKKLSNIIGTIIINSSNSKKNLNDLSRNIFTLSTIYSIHNDNKNIYFKTGINTGYTNITLPKIGPVAFVKLAIVIAKPFTAPRCSASQLLLINKNELVNILISKTTCMLRNMAAHVKSIAVSAVENCEVNGIKIIVGTLKRPLKTQKFIGGIYFANLGKIDD